jgi:hypothetical protein
VHIIRDVYVAKVIFQTYLEQDLKTNVGMKPESLAAPQRLAEQFVKEDEFVKRYPGAIHQGCVFDYFTGF